MRRIVLLTYFISTLLAPAVARAHVLTPSTTGELGAIVHITPDDDPIAGQHSSVFLDIKNAELRPETTKLVISRADGWSEEIPITIDGSVVAADYVFPAPGDYVLTLIAGASDQPDKFEHHVQVAREAKPAVESTPNGQAATNNNRPKLAGVLAVLLLVIILAVIGRKHLHRTRTK